MRLQDCRDSRPKQAGRRAGRRKTMAYMQTRRTEHRVRSSSRLSCRSLPGGVFMPVSECVEASFRTSLCLGQRVDNGPVSSSLSCTHLDGALTKCYEATCRTDTQVLWDTSSR